ncbi:hypothetical protein QJS10_CPA08g01092 [Acorus calamus]|uniref:Uncharacterized protein n=1 Tax=Acorus calamus TaxID=4465 RepID=A0AAV9ECJ2_ACOCL|nr:hypothetical protein QJS10_CPA08g01092 [Acorus calamus]
MLHDLLDPDRGDLFQIRLSKKVVGNNFFTGITRLCKGLAVVLVARYALLQIFPSASAYLALIPARVRHIRVDTCSDRSTDLCRPNETHFDWASVDTYLDSSTDLCRPGEEHFDWTLSNWEVNSDYTSGNAESLGGTKRNIYCKSGNLNRNIKK